MAFEVFNFGKQLGIVKGGSPASLQTGSVSPGITRSDLGSSMAGTKNSGSLPFMAGKTAIEWPSDPCFDGNLVITDIIEVESSPLDPGYRRLIVDCIPRSSGGGVQGPVSYGDPTVPTTEPKWNCTPKSEVERIKAVYNAILSFPCWNDLSMEDALRAVKKLWESGSLEMECRPKESGTCSAHTESGGGKPVKIILCKDALYDPSGKNATDHTGWLAKNLLHELIHAIGGGEIDAEAMENACLKSATTPTPDDWILMKQKKNHNKDGNPIVLGKYFILDIKTGKVHRLYKADIATGEFEFSTDPILDWSKIIPHLSWW